MNHDDATPITGIQVLLDRLVAEGLVVDGLTITEQGQDVWILTATVTGGAIRRLLVEHRPTVVHFRHLASQPRDLDSMEAL